VKFLKFYIYIFYLFSLSSEVLEATGISADRIIQRWLAMKAQIFAKKTFDFLLSRAADAKGLLA
jgi:hypothetical protein